jgi:hypothetical protein
MAIWRRGHVGAPQTQGTLLPGPERLPSRSWRLVIPIAHDAVGKGGPAPSSAMERRKRTGTLISSSSSP